MSPRRRRPGLSALEILIASTLLVAAFIPIYTAIRGTHRTASLNELHVLARRRARRVLAHLAGHTYPDLVDKATGDSPPSGVPVLPSEGAEILFRLRSAAEEEIDLTAQIDDMPFGVLDSYKDRVDAMTVRAYFYEFPDEPGLARISVHVSWKDPAAGGNTRHYVGLRFVEDPFHWRRE